MIERRYTSGELATATGLTLRTIQHYDNIGLLPSSGRTDGGRRYYTKDDLIQLEQIIFYKALGFPLDKIKKNLIPQSNKNELMEMLKNQQLLLLQKIEHLHTSFATIGIIIRMIDEGKEPPLHMLLRFLSALPSDDIFSHVPDMLTKEQQQSFAEYDHDIESVQIFYHKWKTLLIEATIMLHENISYDSAAAQDLAKCWWETILFITGDNTSLIKQISELHLENQVPTNNKEMMEASMNFINSAFDYYASQNDLHFDTE